LAFVGYVRQHVNANTRASQDAGIDIHATCGQTV